MCMLSFPATPQVSAGNKTSAYFSPLGSLHVSTSPTSLSDSKAHPRELQAGAEDSGFHHHIHNGSVCAAACLKTQLRVAGLHSCLPRNNLCKAATFSTQREQQCHLLNHERQNCLCSQFQTDCHLIWQDPCTRQQT